MDASMAAAVQRLGVCLPVQGTWAQSLIRGEPTYQGQPSPWAMTIESVPWTLGAAVTETQESRACALQQEKLPR